MKTIFYVLALLTIGAAAFFSSENKGKFQKQQDTRLEKIATNKRVLAHGDKTKIELDGEKKTLDGAERDYAEAVESILSLKSKQGELKRELAEVEADIEGQMVTIQEAQDAVAQAEKVFKELGIPGDVNIDTIKENMDRLNDEKKELNQAVAELETNIESNQTSVSKNRTEIGRLSKRKAERDERIGQNAMESVITAVDNDWGFVVIGAGTNTGFTPQTRLIVKREGRAIAEVKPSSIEASQTIAEIDMETLAPGVRLQPGDRVILTKPATN